MPAQRRRPTRGGYSRRNRARYRQTSEPSLSLDFRSWLCDRPGGPIVSPSLEVFRALSSPAPHSQDVGSRQRFCDTLSMSAWRVTARFDRSSSALSSDHFGGCSLGELAHSSMSDAVSACRALLISASLSGPGRSLLASAFSRSANVARRSLKEVVCLNRRRCMTQPRCLRVLTVGFAISDS
jgi:hypothetical protein